MSYVKFDEKTKVWTAGDGCSVPIYNPKISMSHIVMRSLEQHGPKIAQVMKTQKPATGTKKSNHLISILDKR